MAVGYFVWKIRKRSAEAVARRSHIFAGLALTASVAFAQAQSSANAMLVTPDNFIRAETDMIYATSVKTQGLGRFSHHRELIPLCVVFVLLKAAVG